MRYPQKDFLNIFPIHFGEFAVPSSHNRGRKEVKESWRAKEKVSNLPLPTTRRGKKTLLLLTFRFASWVSLCSGVLALQEHFGIFSFIFSPFRFWGVGLECGGKGEEEERLSVKTSNYFSPFSSFSLGRQQKKLMLDLLLLLLLLCFFFKMFQIFLCNNNSAGAVASESTQNPHWHVMWGTKRREGIPFKVFKENRCVYASECGMCLWLRGTAQASLSLHVIQDAYLRQRRERRKYEKLQRVRNPSISRKVSVSLSHIWRNVTHEILVSFNRVCLFLRLTCNSIETFSSFLVPFVPPRRSEDSLTLIFSHHTREGKGGEKVRYDIWQSHMGNMTTRWEQDHT